MEMNNFLPLFPGSDITKKMMPEDLNKILLHAVTNSWAKQYHLQGWYFNINTYKETCAVFEQIKIAIKVYEGGEILKNC